MTDSNTAIKQCSLGHWCCPHGRRLHVHFWMPNHCPPCAPHREQNGRKAEG